jgi:putative FmdB family regulatory protein
VPTYEYACTACAERFEVVQRITDAALTECPACGQPLRKVIHPVGVVFKGGGFYKTDSRGTKPSSSSSSSSPATSAPAPAKPAEPSPSTGTSEAQAS